MRVITWNMRKASLRSEAWNYLLELDPDIALIQDAGPVPDAVRSQLAIASDAGTYIEGRVARHMTLILARGEIGEFRPLPVPNWWVGSALQAWREYFTTRTVMLPSGESLNVMSVYSLAIPVPRSWWEDQNVSSIKLVNNPKIWGTELMVATLRANETVATEPWIVAGDLDSSLLFDHPKPQGNAEIQERMEALGFMGMLRATHGHTPTWRNNRGDIRYQLDHLFMTGQLSDRVVSCNVGDAQRVWGPKPSLSDHLPIVVDVK